MTQSEFASKYRGVARGEQTFAEAADEHKGQATARATEQQGVEPVQGAPKIGTADVTSRVKSLLRRRPPETMTGK